MANGFNVGRVWFTCGGAGIKHWISKLGLKDPVVIKAVFEKVFFDAEIYNWELDEFSTGAPGLVYREAFTDSYAGSLERTKYECQDVNGCDNPLFFKAEMGKYYPK